MIIRNHGTRQDLIDSLMAAVAARRAGVSQQATAAAMHRLSSEADGIEHAVSVIQGWTQDPEPATVVSAFGGAWGHGAGGGNGTGGSNSGGNGGAAGQGGGGGSGGGGGGNAAASTRCGSAGGGAGAQHAGQCQGCGQWLYLVQTFRTVHQDGTPVCGGPGTL